MELINEFRVDAPIEMAWATLTDIEGIAPCMPGAQLTEIDGEDFLGSVKVKVGPISAQYRGKARFIEIDDVGYSAVIDASGRDSRGAGNVNAAITMKLSADGEATAVVVTTDLKITGKVAQFGRGVMADISEKLLGQFVECLEAKLAEAQAPAADGHPVDSDEDQVDNPAVKPEATASQAASGPRKIDMPEANPVDLLETAGLPVFRRAAPFLVALGLLILFRRRR